MIMRSCQCVLPFVLASLTVIYGYSVSARGEVSESMSGTVAQWNTDGSRLLRSGGDKSTAGEERGEAPSLLRFAVMKVMKSLSPSTTFMDVVEQAVSMARFKRFTMLIEEDEYGVIRALMLGYHPLQLKTWLEHDSTLAGNMAISLTHWARFEKTDLLLYFINEQRILLKDPEPGSEAANKLWNVIYDCLSLYQKGLVNREVNKVTDMIIEDLSEQEFLSRGVSPYLYRRAIEVQAAKLEKTLLERGFKGYHDFPREKAKAWFDGQLQKFEAFVNAYEEQLNLPEMYAVLPEFKFFGAKDVAEVRKT